MIFFVISSLRYQKKFVSLHLEKVRKRLRKEIKAIVGNFSLAKMSLFE